MSRAATGDPSMWHPVRQGGTLAGRIATKVEELIRTSSLSPGDRLPSEKELAHMLAVSRPSLREAIRTLEARGQLIVKHGRGVFVTDSRSGRDLRHALGETEMTLNELFAMREVLELPAAAWAAKRITAEEVDRLRDVLAEMEVALSHEPKDCAAITRLDAAFHLGIAAAAENRFLRQTSHVLHDMITAGMESTLAIHGRAAQAQLEHTRMLAALEQGDATGARMLARKHIAGSRRAALWRVHGQEEEVEGPPPEGAQPAGI